MNLYLPSIHGNGPVGAFEPNAIESELIRLVQSHPEQQRPIMALNTLMCQVARAKALDMALRGYEDHTDPDGHGPNWRLRQAGYRLPSFYGKDLDDNNVESLQWAGDGDLSDAWPKWLLSEGHKIHILGQNKFYAVQHNFGMGFADVEGSRMRYYYCFISAPPEGMFE